MVMVTQKAVLDFNGASFWKILEATDGTGEGKMRETKKMKKKKKKGND